jgi:tetratricopeptide (TPR) repeat protein
LASGDIQSAIEHFNRTIQVSVDPFLSYWARFLLSTSYATGDLLEEAANTAEEVIKFSKEFGSEILGTSAKGFHVVYLLAKGNLDEGIRVGDEVMEVYHQNGSMYRIATAHLMQGRVYLRLIQRAGPKSFSFLFRNIGFLLKNVPFARKKAEENFNKAIEVAKEIGAKGVLGQAYLGLGLLHKAKKRNDRARECISEAIRIFEQCEAEIFVKQAKEAMVSLG